MEIEPQRSLLSVTLDESLKLGVTWTAVAGAVTGTKTGSEQSCYYFHFVKEQTTPQFPFLLDLNPSLGGCKRRESNIEAGLIAL